MTATLQVTCDLLLVVPDDDIRWGITTLVQQRQTALGLRKVSVESFAMMNRDPGCFKESPDVVRERRGSFSRALVLFDREGCGQDEKTVDAIEEDVRYRLALVGCGDCADVVVFDPEFDILAWSYSPHVDRILGWQSAAPSIREWLEQEGFAMRGDIKPARPKEALEAALRCQRIPWSASIFAQLAAKVSVKKCVDPSFARLVRLPRRWFPAQ